MKSRVSIRKASDYNLDTLKKTVQESVDDLGGFDQFVSRSDRVLLKPNLLMSAVPEKALVTHPAFVQAVASLLIDHGAKVFIGDSPPLGNLARVLGKSGYTEFMKTLNIEPCAFVRKLSLECSDGRLYRRLDLAAEVFEFDRVVNLPKLKTHTQMGLTLAVKNLFGTVLGTDKASWHLRAGKNTDNFATVLVQILEQIQPAVSIVDGILAMEGNGPNNGKPRFVGIVASSKDAIALDATIAFLVGYPPGVPRTSEIGQDLGLGVADVGNIEILGDDLGDFPLKDFKFPRPMSMAWNLSYWNPVRRFVENHVIVRPRINPALCQKCGVCVSHCPPGAISDINETLKIDPRKCISCFCCHELCVNNAVDILEPYLGKLLSRISR